MQTNNKTIMSTLNKSVLIVSVILLSCSEQTAEQKSLNSSEPDASTQQVDSTVINTADTTLIADNQQTNNELANAALQKKNNKPLVY